MHDKEPLRIELSLKQLEVLLRNAKEAPNSLTILETCNIENTVDVRIAEAEFLLSQKGNTFSLKKGL